MWHRRRGSKITRTRRALGVPAVAGNVSALIAEMLEDRTLLSGIAEDGNESWAELLRTNDSVVWLLPSDAVTWIAAKSGDAESGDVVVQLDAESNWHEFVRLSVNTDESISIKSQVLLVVEWSAGNTSDDDGSIGVADAFDTPFVQITIRSTNDSLIAASLPQDFVSRNNAPAFQGSSVSNIGQPTDDPTDQLIPVIAKPVESSKSGGSGSVNASVAVAELATPTTNVGKDVRSEASSLPGVTQRQHKEFNNVELTGIGLELVLLRSDDVSQPAANFTKTSTKPATASIASVPVEPDSISIEQTVSFVSLNSTDAAGSFDVVASAMTPVEGLQAAAAPVVAVIETLLASLDTAARALLALLTGSGGSSSPVAPTAQPILNSTQVVFDPKRPRWALHDGLVEELAVYSLVVANDQHFDLKDFGPASRAADPVVRIEFDVPPQHGQVASTAIPGAFRYSADPGFSGVDTARFRVTRASGQTVAGAVTIFVEDPGLPAGPASVRQVELPVDDRRVSEMDAGFRLSDGWLDLP